MNEEKGVASSGGGTQLDDWNPSRQPAATFIAQHAAIAAAALVGALAFVVFVLCWCDLQAVVKERVSCYLDAWSLLRKHWIWTRYRSY